MDINQTSQFAEAQQSYRTRAQEYDNSWHPQYTSRFMSLITINPNDRVLILACGTGLEAVIAAPLVGPNGLVVGVDATKEMLDMCRQKQAADEVLSRRLVLIQHDITDLESLDLEKGSFDVVICSNAFILFDDVEGVISQWKEYLSPGGKMMIDIPHENNPRQGLFMKTVVEEMGLEYPASRSWIQSVDSLTGILERQGLEVIRVEALDKKPGKGHVLLGKEHMNEMFDYITRGQFTGYLASEEFRTRARGLFEREWDVAAEKDNGKVRVSYVLYVYVAQKA